MCRTCSRRSPLIRGAHLRGKPFDCSEKLRILKFPRAATAADRAHFGRANRFLAMPVAGVRRKEFNSIALVPRQDANFCRAARKPDEYGFIIRRNAMLSRRTFVSLAAATAAAPRLAPAQPAPAPKSQFYEKGGVRIRYEEVGSGFPLLVTPGGGLNSRISNWATAVFNAPETFKSDFRVITMDQRNANGGESTGPIPVDDPWGAFADDQLGLMDHLGIPKFFFMGYCIGGPFALKLMERAPDRVVAAVVPAGRASAGQSGLHVQFRQGCLGARIAQAAARPGHGDDLKVPAQPLPDSAR